MGSAGIPVRMTTAPAAAWLLGGAVALAMLAGVVLRKAPAPDVQATASTAELGPHGRQALERCRYNVIIIHDVHWAAACESNAREVRRMWQQCLQASARCEAEPEPADDMPDCTLPPERASALNHARAAAEHQCVDEAAFTERIALRQAQR